MIKTRLTSFKKTCLLACFSLCFYSGTGHAQSKVDKLTKNNIENFVQTLTEMTSGNNLESSSSQIIQFLESHLHPKARFKSALVFNVPGHPAQENSMALDKEDFINSLADGAKAVQSYESSVEVKNIRISKDKKKATLKTESREQGMMNVEGEQIPVEGNSSCDQIIMLSDDGIIQMYNANCKTVIEFQEF